MYEILVKYCFHLYVTDLLNVKINNSIHEI